MDELIHGAFDLSTINFFMLHIFFLRTLLEVTVSHVVNPAYFFIQQNQNWEQLDALSRNLDEFFKVR